MYYRFCIIILITFIFISSCKDKNNVIEVIDTDKIYFNGKYKRFFTLKDFETKIGKVDSIRLINNEETCSTIFENTSESEKNIHQYLFKDGSRFENYDQQVAIDEFKFSNGNFLKYDNFILDSTTTIGNLKKIFPNAVKEIKQINVKDEGTLEVISLKENNNTSDGNILLFFKNGRLYTIHWWFPC